MNIVYCGALNKVGPGAPPPQSLKDEWSAKFTCIEALLIRCSHQPFFKMHMAHPPPARAGSRPSIPVWHCFLAKLDPIRDSSPVQEPLVLLKAQICTIICTYMSTLYEASVSELIPNCTET